MCVDLWSVLKASLRFPESGEGSFQTVSALLTPPNPTSVLVESGAPSRALGGTWTVECCTYHS